MPDQCPRCGGFIYADDPRKIPPYTDTWKSDVWCLICGEWIPPPGFKPLPYVVHQEDRIDENSWYIDGNGDIIDGIDRKIEELIEAHPERSFNVSYVAKAVHCSNSEARMTLDRLTRHGEMELYRYGPQDRWLAYRRVGASHVR